MNKINLLDIPLQPLQVCAGWYVEQNTFTIIEPYSNIKVQGLPDEDPWELFAQDMLYMEHKAFKVILDLGWIPEADPEGSYLLRVVKNNDWDNPVFIYKSKNKDDIVQKINLWLAKISSQF